MGTILPATGAPGRSARLLLAASAPMLRECRTVLGLGKGADALPLDLVASQAKAARSTYPLTFAMTICACIGLLWAMDSSPRIVALRLGCAQLLAASIVNLWFWHRDHRRGWAIANARSRVIGLTLLHGSVGLSWNMMLALALYTGDAQQATFVTCIITGVLCVGALSVATVRWPVSPSWRPR